MEFFTLETDKLDGKAVRTKRMMIVTPGDGRSMDIIVTENIRDSGTVLVADKQ